MGFHTGRGVSINDGYGFAGLHENARGRRSTLYRTNRRGSDDTSSGNCEHSADVDDTHGRPHLHDATHSHTDRYSIPYRYTNPATDKASDSDAAARWAAGAHRSGGLPG